MAKKRSEIQAQFIEKYDERQIEQMMYLARLKDSITDQLEGLARDIERARERHEENIHSWHPPVSTQDLMKTTIAQEKMSWISDQLLLAEVKQEDIEWVIN